MKRILPLFLLILNPLPPDLSFVARFPSIVFADGVDFFCLFLTRVLAASKFPFTPVSLLA
jgi:hypothetical protein